MICLSWLGWVWKECRCKVKSMNEPLMLHSKKVNQIPSNHALHKSRRKSWRLDLGVQDACLGLMLCFLQLIRRSGLPSGYPPCFDDEAATHSSSPWSSSRHVLAAWFFEKLSTSLILARWDKAFAREKSRRSWTSAPCISLVRRRSSACWNALETSNDPAFWFNVSLNCSTHRRS